MKRTFLSAPFAVGALLLLCIPTSFLSAQSGGPCPFTFEPEYMGEGNCFRIILRNNDPQRAPYWVQHLLLDPGVIEAGNVEPARSWGRREFDRWQFTNYNPLLPGDVDTGYVCFIASVPTMRLAVAWGDEAGSVLCRDTVRLDMPHVNRGCFEITGLRIECAFPETDLHGPVMSKTTAAPGWNELLPVSLFFNLQNRADGGVGSVELSGWSCTMEKGSVEGMNSPTPFPPGTEFGLSHYSNISPDDPICFGVDEEGWNLIPLDIIFFDSAKNHLCTDSIVILINEFNCALGSVVESPSGDDSMLNLRIAGLESGEASISFLLEQRTNVRLLLADMRGNEVLRIIDDRTLESGENRAVLNTAGIGSGTYLCLLQAGEFREGRVIRIVE